MRCRYDGSASERIAYAITNEIIERADYLVDMHAGDANESLRPYTYWSRLGLDARVDSLAREVALAWGNDHIVIDDDRPRSRDSSVYTQNTAQVRGKPAITTETGYLGVAADDMVQRNERGHTVQKGTVIGYVTDFFGTRMGDVVAPFAGAVLYVIGTPATSKGEPLAMIGHVREEP